MKVDVIDVDRDIVDDGCYGEVLSGGYVSEEGVGTLRKTSIPFPLKIGLIHKEGHADPPPLQK